MTHTHIIMSHLFRTTEISAIISIALKFGGGSIMELISYVEAYGMKKSFEKLLEKNKKTTGKLPPSDIASVTKYFAQHVNLHIKHGVVTHGMDHIVTTRAISRENVVDSLLNCEPEKVIKCTMKELELSIPLKKTLHQLYGIK